MKMFVMEAASLNAVTLDFHYVSTGTLPDLTTVEYNKATVDPTHA